MALGSGAMTRVFEKNSKAKIEPELRATLGRLAGICSCKGYDELHESFCRWFTREIRTAKGNKAASYGQAAKVLDIATKVFCYFCGLPSKKESERMIPWLHAAIDTPILKCLKSKYRDRKITATTLGEIDMETYQMLQSLVRDSALGMDLVRYEDWLWHKLNAQRKVQSPVTNPFS